VHPTGGRLRVFKQVAWLGVSSGKIGLSLFEIIPRYIVLSIPPPKDSYDLVGWNSTTKSVINTSSGREFIWRQDATLAYENPDNTPSWNMLAKYFTERLLQIGWRESDNAVPCNIYLPEAALLNYGENGFVAYLSVNDTEEIPRGDAICLAIWNDKGYANVFRVVLLTVKQSFFTSFYQIPD